ncbi:MAG: putative membrane protein, partial [uncultured Solirubrobacteraceae bacterium]
PAGQSLPVPRGLGDRDPRHAPPPRRAVVRGRLPVHGRNGPIARAADGLRPLHRGVGHLLRAHSARWRRAGRADRADPRADRQRPARAGHRVGAAVGRGRCRDRGGMAGRGQAARGGEHGPGAHHDLHAAVRRDADHRGGHLRRHRDRRRVRPRAARRLRRAAGRRPGARPLRDDGAGAVRSRGADGPRPTAGGHERPRARRDGARLDAGPHRRARVHAEPHGCARPQPRPAGESRRRRAALAAVPHGTNRLPPPRAMADLIPTRPGSVGSGGRRVAPAALHLRL